METLLAYLLVMFIVGVGVTTALIGIIAILLGILSPFIVVYFIWLACTTLYRRNNSDEGLQHKQD